MLILKKEVINVSQKVRIHTDGSCLGNPGPGGWGAVISLPDEKLVISGYTQNTTNNQMELKAVIEALEFTLSLGYNKIDIYSDSAYVVNSVKKGWLKKWELNGWKTNLNKQVKNKDLWMQLVKILRKNGKNKVRINVIKIKGHAGNRYNEQADELARSEITRNFERRGQTL